MSSIIEVAIGMVFTYSLLSILITQINNFVLYLLNLRAQQLREGLIHLISDKQLQAKMLAHPLIRMVNVRVNPVDELSSDQVRDILKKDTTRVAHIAPDTFVEALMSLLTSSATGLVYRPLEEAISFLPDDDRKLKLREMLRDLKSFGDTSTGDVRDAIMELPDETHKQVLSYALEQVEDELARGPVSSGDLVPLLDGMNKIKDEAFREAIRVVLVTARNIDEARAKLRAWFDDGMSRLTEIYKGKMQVFSLVAGLTLTLLLNADTLQLLQSFWDDPALRQSVAAAARTASTSGQTPPTAEAPPANGSLDQSASQVDQTVQQLLQLQLPIGWEYTEITPEMVATSQTVGLPDPRGNLRNLWNLLPGGSPDWLGNLLRKIIGLVVTVIAAAQGAPFWFDLLRRITGGGSSQQAPSNNLQVTVNAQPSNPAG